MEKYLLQTLFIPLMLLVDKRECGIEVKTDSTAIPPRMHHQLNMRGPHHPRVSDPVHSHHRPHYQLQRPSEDGSHPNPKITQDTNLLRDAEHIREDLENVMPMKDTKKMTPDEMEFFYFKLHDFDNNTKLDGLEILQAIRHVMHTEHEEERLATADPSQLGEGEFEIDPLKKPEYTENIDEDDFIYFVELIDQVLEEDDLDDDGFLSYAEYVQGRKNDHIKRETVKS